MLTWRFEETIERPAQQVWEFATDIDHQSEWMGVTDARLVSGRATEVGARSLNTFKLGPREYEAEMEVSAAQAGRQIGWRVVRGAPFDGEFVLDLEPLGGDRTHAVWHGWLQTRGIWRLLEPIMAREVREGEARELRRLKQAVESGSPIAEHA